MPAYHPGIRPAVDVSKVQADRREELREAVKIAQDVHEAIDIVHRSRDRVVKHPEIYRHEAEEIIRILDRCSTARRKSVRAKSRISSVISRGSINMRWRSAGICDNLWSCCGLCRKRLVAPAVDHVLTPAELAQRFCPDGAPISVIDFCLLYGDLLNKGCIDNPGDQGETQAVKKDLRAARPALPRRSYGRESE